MEPSTLPYAGEFLAEVSSAVRRIPQGRCDCMLCWSVEQKQDGFWYCRTCERFVAPELD